MAIPVPCTSPEADEVQVALLRRASSALRAERALSLSAEVSELVAVHYGTDVAGTDAAKDGRGLVTSQRGLGGPTRGLR